MICKNCGTELVEGAKFCSECGAKVEELIVRDFDTLTFDEIGEAPGVSTAGAADAEAVTTETPNADEAVKSKVSFDWSNVIDEPQKKEIPQEIKSPWASVTDTVDEREIYAGMAESDDKNRTMNFIDVIKADKEERDRAAIDKSIEYTEVLEIDPELLGGTKPPRMHYAPLYDDVDEPVKTPFDDIEDEANEPQVAANEVMPATDAGTAASVEDIAGPHASDEPETSGKFELPDFLKKAVGIGASKSVERSEPEAEAPVIELPEETEGEISETPEFGFEAEAPVIELPEETKGEISETPEFGFETEAPVIELPEEPEGGPGSSFAEEEPRAEEAAIGDFASDEPSEEDLYLDIDETSTDTARMSRVDAHTIAGDYDLFDADDEDESNTDNASNEDDYTGEHELEAEEHDVEADEHAEETDEFVIETEETSADDSDNLIDEDALFAEMSETLPGNTGMTIAAPADEEEEIEALKRRLAELTGTHEIDPSLFEDTGIENEYVGIDETGFGLGETDSHADAGFGLSQSDESAYEPSEEVSFEEDHSVFNFEPEVTEADDELFAGLVPASEKTGTPVAPHGEAHMFDIYAPVEPVDIEPPKPWLSSDQEDIFGSLNFDIPNDTPKHAAATIDPSLFEESSFDDVTSHEESIFDEASSYDEPSPEKELSFEDLFIDEEPVAPAAAEKIEIDPPKAWVSSDQKDIFESLNFDVPSEAASVAAAVTVDNKEPASGPVIEEPRSWQADLGESDMEKTKSDIDMSVFDAFINEESDPDSPIVGFAPAVTESEAETFAAAYTESGSVAFETTDTESKDPSPAITEIEQEATTKNVVAASVTGTKPTDAMSLDELESDLFKPGGDDVDAETTKKIDKFYTLYRKNEEFQRLLDEEYSRLKGENIEVSEEEVDALVTHRDEEKKFSSDADGASKDAAEEAADALLDELASEGRPVEDATIYRTDMPEELAELAAKTEPEGGFSVGNTAVESAESKEEKSFGLDGSELAGAAAVGAAGAAAAGAAAKNADKADKKAKKKEAKAAKAAAKAAAKSSGDPQVEYEDVDGGSMVLTVLAVIVAILLVVLLAIILILQFAPDSGIAMSINSIIENITSRFSAIDSFESQRLI